MLGLCDTADLPLNVSLELLQNNRTVEKIKAALVKRSLELLEDLAANKPEEYAEFWKTFGVVLKEGIIEDPSQKERIAKLLRFHSTAATAHVPEVSLQQYVSRMQTEQKAGYYLTANTPPPARNGPTPPRPRAWHKLARLRNPRHAIHGRTWQSWHLQAR